MCIRDRACPPRYERQEEKLAADSGRTRDIPVSHLASTKARRSCWIRVAYDDQFGDMVALEHIALLGEGHCLTLIQQLVGFVKRRGSRAALAHGMVYRLEGWFLR